MTEILKHPLFTDFPSLFPNINHPENFLVPYGIPEEWLDLVYELTRKIYEHIQGKPEFANFHVRQIKPKFGTLRYYCFPKDDYISQLINAAYLETERLNTQNPEG